MNNDFRRVFAMLRSVRGGNDRAAGFARFELKGNKVSSSMTAQGLLGGETYALLLSKSDGADVFEVGRIKTGGSGQGMLNASFSLDSFDSYNCAALISCLDGKTALAGIYGKEPMRDWDAIDKNFAKYLGIYDEPEEVPEIASEEIAAPVFIAEERLIDVSADFEDAVEAVESAAEDTETELEEFQEISKEPLDDDKSEPIWSGYALSLHPLFEKGEPHIGFDELENVKFVKALIPMDEEKYYLIGADMNLETIESVYIAIPGQYAEEAPPSLLGSRWYKDKNGEGFWIKIAGA